MFHTNPTTITQTEIRLGHSHRSITRICCYSAFFCYHWGYFSHANESYQKKQKKRQKRKKSCVCCAWRSLIERPALPVQHLSGSSDRTGNSHWSPSTENLMPD